MRNHLLVVPLLLIGLLAANVQAVDYFVDQKDPGASDNNPGTKAKPLRTIQAALDKAQPGDRVEVRAGIYHESVRFKTGGSNPRWASTLEAYQDEHVILDGAAAIPADRWKLVEGCKNIYWTPFESQRNYRVDMVFIDGSLIPPTLKNVAGANSSLIEGTSCNIMPAMPDDTPNDQGYYHDQQQKKLFVNLGGRVPGKDVECKPVRLCVGVEAYGPPYVRIRKLEIRNFISRGIFADYCLEIMVEDNYIHHCGCAFWGCYITGGRIRHNTITDSMGTAMGIHGARGLIVEENVILRPNLNPYKVASWGGCAIICNGAQALVLRNNVIADCPDSGVWPDCCGNGITIYGNTAYRMRCDGFYIEAGVYGTILRWNTVFDSGSGITFRENFGNTAFENYLLHNGRALGIYSCDQDNRPKANVMMYNWLIDNGMGAVFGPDLSKQPAHVFDHNVYKFQDWPDVDIRGRKPTVSKIDKNINVGLTMDHWPGTKLRGQFWTRWTGSIRIEKDGPYKFYITYHNVNGARLFIDNKQVVCSGETRGPSTTEKECQSQLTAGDHAIMLDFYHGHGSVVNLWKCCVLSWQPPGGAKALVPEDVLFHKGLGANDLQPGLKADFFDIAGSAMPLDLNGAVVLQYGNKQYKDLPALRADLGMEIHGQVVAEFDPASLGLVTFRVPGAKRSWEPVPMLGNPLPQRGDVVAAYAPYFWKKGSFRGVEDYDWRGAGCGFGDQTRADGSAFVRMYLTSCHWDIIHQFDDPTAGRPGHMAYLQVGAVPKRTVSAEGFGYWSPDLPTTDGAQIDLSLWIRAKDIKAAKENGGLYALAEFHNETGQDVTRQYLIGPGDGQEAVGTEWMTGNFKHKQLTGKVTAPKGARWFKLGFGLRNCTGWASFNDIDIQTRPGTPEVEVKKVMPIDASKFTWTPCDLAGLLNRPLADDSTNGGKVGWTDQGALMDLRSLQAGDYTWNGVTFRVAKGNACLIMKNKHRPSENLPHGGKVDLKGKSDVLALLHTGAWIDQGVWQATYIVHYADGTKVEIPVIGGKNILDWTTPPDRADDVKYDPALGLILPATTVASPQFVHVTVWMVLWKNPHPDKEISALEVKGANEGIPGLIGVSAGTAK